jgi:hypothetical protein
VLAALRRAARPCDPEQTSSSQSCRCALLRSSAPKWVVHLPWVAGMCAPLRSSVFQAIAHWAVPDASCTAMRFVSLLVAAVCALSAVGARK